MNDSTASGANSHNVCLHLATVLLSRFSVSRGLKVHYVYSSQQHHRVTYSPSHFADDTIEVQGSKKSFLVAWNLNRSLRFFFSFPKLALMVQNIITNIWVYFVYIKNSFLLIFLNSMKNFHWDAIWHYMVARTWVSPPGASTRCPAPASSHEFRQFG